VAESHGTDGPACPKLSHTYILARPKPVPQLKRELISVAKHRSTSLDNKRALQIADQPQ